MLSKWIVVKCGLKYKRHVLCAYAYHLGLLYCYLNYILKSELHLMVILIS